MSGNRFDRALGIDAAISRRDFVNGTLAAAGAVALASCGAAKVAGTTDQFSPSGSDWTGYGGQGDYRWSNGNTREVIDAAHGIRDGLYEELAAGAVDESHDVVVVGGGFSGISAAYEFAANARPGESLLLLDNHPIFGGEAKQNDIFIGDDRLTGPQGSNGAGIPSGKEAGTVGEAYARIYGELGLPKAYDLLPLAGGAEKLNLADDHYLPMLLESEYPTGYYFRDKGWVKNPIAGKFEGTPWSPEARRDLIDFNANARDLVSKQANPDRWLDTMTYRELLEKLGYGGDVISYVDPLVGVGNFGVCSDGISARAAQMIALPGTYPSAQPNRWSGAGTISFPGGNAAIMRAMIQHLFPEAVPGTTMDALASKHPMKLDVLDRAGNAVRIRQSSTVVRVEHEGAPGEAGGVLVTYVRGGKPHRVRAKSVVMATGGWVTRRLVRDMPEDHANAYATFNYGPVLTVNVAVRNWRFFEKLGISVARWFEGFGWHLCARRNMTLGGERSPLTPDSPMMLTFYVPVLFPGEPAATQGALARQKIFETPFVDYERQVRQQMTDMFASVGFDARRDIAGIVVNRWGHAYFAPPPGFFYGKDGGKPASDIIRTPHGRIVFAHSELHGRMSMRFAVDEGTRGARTAMALARG